MQNIIFDIDGTLVQSTAFDGDCFRQAVKDVLGNVSIRNDWGDYTNVTDEGILQEVYSDNGLPFAGSARVQKQFGQLVAEHLAGNPAACLETPGASLLLEQLSHHPDIKLGIATGGWLHTAKAKLNHAEIEVCDIPIVSSNDGARRIDIMKKCSHVMNSAATQTIYVGDGEWDQYATESLGWQFVGIGPRLKGKCSNWIPDLTAFTVSHAI